MRSKSEEVRVVIRELERLLNDAACAYDAAEMDKVAEYLRANNVVVLPCGVGDKVYAVYDGTDDVVLDARVEELTVTEVGTKRIFCSSYVPPRDDIDYEIPISELGISVFLRREDAEKAARGGGD